MFPPSGPFAEVFMQPILDFLDRYAIDPHVYVVAHGPDLADRYELFWDRDATVHWRLRAFGASEWEHCSSARLIARLNELGIDIVSVEQQVRGIVLMQVVFADTLLTEARDVFGEHGVRQALRDHADFLSDLRHTVLSLTRGTLRPVLGGGEGSPVREGHLSIVQSA
jgi:hypothetical protein